MDENKKILFDDKDDKGLLLYENESDNLLTILTPYHENYRHLTSNDLILAMFVYCVIK